MTLKKTDLSQIISAIQIQDVRLVESRCHTSVRRSALPENIRVTMGHQVEWTMDPDTDSQLCVKVSFELGIMSEEEDEQLAEVRGVFELVYVVPKPEAFAREEFEGFSEVNGVFNAWPYWREQVHSSMARMSLPPITVPLHRVLQQAKTDDDVPDEAETPTEENKERPDA